MTLNKYTAIAAFEIPETVISPAKLEVWYDQLIWRSTVQHVIEQSQAEVDSVHPNAEHNLAVHKAFLAFMEENGIDLVICDRKEFDHYA